MKTIIFFIHIMVGNIQPNGDHEGRQMYSFKTKKGETIETAYKGEILNYLSTGVFMYDEFLKDN
jgi:hypothetical protein